MTAIFCIRSAVLLLCLQLALSAVTIRVRLSNGAMQRLEVDEEATTVASLREKLKDIGAINEFDTSFEIGTQKFPVLPPSESSNENEQATVKSLGLKAGDILKLVAPQQPKVAKEPRKFANTSSSTSTAKSSSSSSAAASTSKSSGKSLSIADLEKKRQEMVKVTRQKTPGNRTVSITPSAGRILKRLAAGGYALLIGKVVSSTAEEKEKTKAAMKSASVKKQSNRGSMNTISSVKKEETTKGPKDIVEVHAVCELYHFGKADDVSPALAAGAETPLDLSTLTTVSVVCDIAKSLGMKIVGCGVGVPQAQGGNHLKKKIMWSPSHVFAALQLKQYADDSKNFVVISASAAVEEPADSSKTKTTTTTKKKKATTSMTADGISIEAFQLSDQALQMFDKGVLKSTRVKEESTPTTSSSNAAGPHSKSGGGNKPVVMTSAALKAMKSDSAKEEEAAQQIKLDGEALVRNQEVTSVDPYLLSVPLPISALVLQQQHNSVGENSPLEFEHSFPTPAELQVDEKMARLAKQHLHRVLGQLASPETKHRMRDPHMLIHMSSILDTPTRNALCKSVVDGTDRFPGMVKMALDMVKMSLGEDSAIGKKRRQGEVEVAEEDD